MTHPSSFRCVGALPVPTSYLLDPRSRRARNVFPITYMFFFFFPRIAVPLFNKVTFTPHFVLLILRGVPLLYPFYGFCFLSAPFKATHPFGLPPPVILDHPPNRPAAPVGLHTPPCHRTSPPRTPFSSYFLFFPGAFAVGGVGFTRPTNSVQSGFSGQSPGK